MIDLHSFQEAGDVRFMRVFIFSSLSCLILAPFTFWRTSLASVTKKHLITVLGVSADAFLVALASV